MTRHSVLYLLVGLTVLIAPLRGQVYLIAGTASTSEFIEDFGSALLQVSDDGSVRSVADLTSPEEGTQWIAISYEWSKALVWQGSPEKLIVIDLDKAAVAKSCEHPLGAVIWKWLAEVPGRGPTFAWYVAGDQPALGHLEGMVLDASVACEESFVTLAPEDIKYMVAHGTGGLRTTAVAEGIRAAVLENGSVSSHLAGTAVSFGYEVPAALRRGFEESYDFVIANSSQVFILGMALKTGDSRVLAFRKKDKAWRQIPLQGYGCWCVRAFGRFIAMPESSSKNYRAQGGTEQGTAKSARTNPARESAGRADWRKDRTARGPSMAVRFNNAEVV